MKLSILLIAVTALQVHANAYSQKPVTLKMQQAEISKVLDHIEKNGDVRFLYNSNLSGLKAKIDIDIQNLPLNETLDRIFASTGLTYKIMDNNLIIVTTKADKNQDINVSGKVTNDKGEPLAGVSIVVKGKNRGTSTDNSGNFSISVPENTTLVITYVGYETKEVAVGKQQVLNVVLTPTNNKLDEVVVVGYGTQSKKNITGSVSTVNLSDMDERPVVNVAEAIQGKAPGVQVVSPSGKPGQTLQVRIRGANSISAGNDPLYVVDGIPTTDINSVNPADIESMSILKDASSAAIYGSRAANGVVLITTKKGSGKKVKVGLNMYTGFSNPTHTISVLDGKQYQQLMDEILGSGAVSDDEVNKNNINWPDEVFRTGVDQNYQLTVSQATNKFKQYYSFGYGNQTGMIAPASFKRMSGRANLSYKATNWLTLSANLGASNNVTRDVTDNASSARGGVVLAAITTPSIVPKYISKDWTAWNAGNPDFMQEGWIGWNPRSGWHNPLAAIEGSKARARANRALSNFAAEIKLRSDLTFKSMLGLDYTDGYDYTIKDPFLTKDGRQDSGKLSVTRYKETNWLTEQTLTYAKKVGSHNFSALGGFTTQTHRWDPTTYSTSKFGRDTMSQGVDYILTHHRERLDTSGYPDEWGLVSGIARVTYDYEGRYLFTGNLRVDVSSKFPKANRTGVFPSFSAGWRISSEKFFAKAKNAVQELKLRAGWGMTGNQEGIGSYDYLRRIYIEPRNGSQKFINYSAPSLTWETTRATNLGLDIAFLKSRVTVNADWYYKKTNKVLVRYLLPEVGLPVPDVSMNTGDLENKGFELNVSTKNIVRGDWRWNTDFNISFNKNKVLNIYEDDPNVRLYAGNIYERGFASIAKAGHELGTFYGYVSKGVSPLTGDMLYADLNHNGVTGAEDPGDRTFIGSAQPKFFYGFTNTVSYKNFDLSVFFQGTQGNQIFNGGRIEMEGMNNSRNQSTVVLGRWSQPGEITDVPRAQADNTNNTLISTRFLEDGSYLRLKAATLAYRFTMKKLGISNASIYMTGNNFLTFTKYTGFDPEVNSFGNDDNVNTKNIALGVDYGAYPQPKTYIIGLNVSF